jgi:hypothetical protein
VVVEAENILKLVVGSVDLVEGQVGGNRIQFSISERLTPEDRPNRRCTGLPTAADELQRRGFPKFARNSHPGSIAQQLTQAFGVQFSVQIQALACGGEC